MENIQSKIPTNSLWKLLSLKALLKAMVWG